MSRKLQPLSVSLVKIDSPTVIKDESPESEIVEIGIHDILEEDEIFPDVKGIDIVYHPVCEDFMKSEILESYHCESVETQDLVNAENSPFIKIENITQINKTEDTSDENVTKGTGQGVVKVQESESESKEEIIPEVKDIDIVYHPVCEEVIKSEILQSYHCEPLETEVLVNAENSPFQQPDIITQRNKTGDTSDENVTTGIDQAVVEVQDSNEYSNVLDNLERKKRLIYLSRDLNSFSTNNSKAKQPEKTTFSKCCKTVGTTSWKKGKEKIKVTKAPVIPVEAHEYTSLAKGKYVCNHCQHACNILDHLKCHIKQMHRKVTTMYQCPYCPYNSKWKRNIKPHIIQKHTYTKDFQCHLCEKKFKLKCNLTRHKKVHLTLEQKMQDGLVKSYHCDKCSYTTYRLDGLKSHKLTHSKPEEIQYFYCYHCSTKFKRKPDLKKHIFRQHFKNVIQGKRHHCDKCNYKTYESTSLKSHKLTHLKPEEIQYLFCYYCSYKTKWRGDLKEHIFKHFKNEEIRFHCYICDFATQKRDLIIEHIREHFKNRNKYDETISKYQLESRINNLKKKVSK